MKARKNSTEEYDAQLEALYGNLGTYLYDNIEKGRVSFVFTPESGDLSSQATALMDKIRSSSVEPRHEEPPVAKAVKPAKPAQPAKIVKPAKTIKQVKAARHEKPVKPEQTVKPEKVAPPEKAIEPAHAVRKAKPAMAVKTEEKKPAEMRGSLQGYSEFLADLFDAKKKILSLKEDLEVCLSLGTLHLGDRATTRTDAAAIPLKMIEEELISLVNDNMEAVKDIMSKKKKHMEKLQEAGAVMPLTLDGEKEFFDKTSADIRKSTRQVDVLVNKAVVLFEEIKHAYEKSMAEDARAKKEPPQRVQEAPQPEPAREDEDALEEARKVEAEVEAELEADDEDHQRYEEGLLETAARRLVTERASPDEKLQILHTLFRTVPGKVVAFLSDLMKELEAPVKRELVGLIIKMDDPLLIDIYTEFLESDEVLLRMHGVMGLMKIDSDEAKDAIVTASRDADASVRRLVVNCLELFGTGSEISAIMRLANDTDETVARVAIRKLSRIRTRVAFTHILSKLENQNPKIRKEAIDALKSTIGTDLGYRYFSPDSDRKAAVKKWQALWARSQSNSDFIAQMRKNTLTREPLQKATPVAVTPKIRRSVKE